MMISTLLLLTSLTAMPPLTARDDNPELRARFENNRKKPRLVVEPQTLSILPDTEHTSLLVVEAVLDGSVMVSVQIMAGQEHVLEQNGAQPVSAIEDIAHNTIHRGRFYRVITLVADAPGAALLEDHLGRPMKMDIAIRSDGREVVLEVRRP